jgi:hypothetical protein
MTDDELKAMLADADNARRLLAQPGPWAVDVRFTFSAMEGHVRALAAALERVTAMKDEWVRTCGKLNEALDEERVRVARLHTLADRVANDLVPVAGELMRRACGDPDEHEADCTCNTCRAFLATQKATTDLAAALEESK